MSILKLLKYFHHVMLHRFIFSLKQRYLQGSYLLTRQTGSINWGRMSSLPWGKSDIDLSAGDFSDLWPRTLHERNALLCEVVNQLTIYRFADKSRAEWALTGNLLSAKKTHYYSTRPVENNNLFWYLNKSRLENCCLKLLPLFFNE